MMSAIAGTETARVSCAVVAALALKVTAPTAATTAAMPATDSARTRDRVVLNTISPQGFRRVPHPPPSHTRLISASIEINTGAVRSYGTDGPNDPRRPARP